VEACVGPGSDGKVGGVFPGLESVAVGEVVGGFPVVEHFIAVLDWGVEGREEMAGEEDVKGRGGGEVEWGVVLFGAGLTNIIVRYEGYRRG